MRSIPWPLAVVLSVALCGVFMCALKGAPVPAAAMTLLTALFAWRQDYNPPGPPPPAVLVTPQQAPVLLVPTDINTPSS